MESEKFNEAIEARLELIRSSLLKKGEEYARNNDKLHNFHEGAKLTGQRPTRVLDGFLLKHIISYRDMLNDIDNGKLIDEDVVREKLGDIINYFILQEVLILDECTDDIDFGK